MSVHILLEGILQLNLERLIHVGGVVELAHLDQDLREGSERRYATALYFVQAFLILVTFGVTSTHHVLGVLSVVPKDAGSLDGLRDEVVTSCLKDIEEHGVVVARLVKRLRCCLRRLLRVTTVHTDIVKFVASSLHLFDLEESIAEGGIHLPLVVHEDLSVVPLGSLLDSHQFT